MGPRAGIKGCAKSRPTGLQPPDLQTATSSYTGYAIPTYTEIVIILKNHKSGLKSPIIKCCVEYSALMIFSLFLAGYFWHITDIHYDAHYSTLGDTRKCKYHVRTAQYSTTRKAFRMWLHVLRAVTCNNATRTVTCHFCLFCNGIKRNYVPLIRTQNKPQFYRPGERFTVS